jgi:hypothetical protein
MDDSKVKIDQVLEMIANKPEETMKQMATAAEGISPEMVDKAKKMAGGENQRHVQTEMAKKHISATKVRKQMKEAKKEKRDKEGPKDQEELVSCILLKHKTLRDKKITPSEIPKALHSKEPINSTCSRLSVGPWENIEISIWHDPNGLSLNDRASKLCSFPIRGDVIFISDFPICSKEFEEVEKALK